MLWTALTRQRRKIYKPKFTERWRNSLWCPVFYGAVLLSIVAYPKLKWFGFFAITGGVVALYIALHKSRKEGFQTLTYRTGIDYVDMLSDKDFAVLVAEVSVKMYDGIGYDVETYPIEEEDGLIYTQPVIRLHLAYGDRLISPVRTYRSVPMTYAVRLIKALREQGNCLSAVVTNKTFDTDAQMYLQDNAVSCVNRNSLCDYLKRDDIKKMAFSKDFDGFVCPFCNKPLILKNRLFGKKAYCIAKGCTFKHKVHEVSWWLNGKNNV